MASSRSRITTSALTASQADGLVAGPSETGLGVGVATTVTGGSAGACRSSRGAGGSVGAAGCRLCCNAGHRYQAASAMPPRINSCVVPISHLALG